jgi:hypothetical protein
VRAHQVFAAMPPEQAQALFAELREKAPATFSQALAVASAALKARPVYLARQPLEKQAAAARRALARVGACDAAEEVLATYFVECQRPLLVEWLDAVGVAHEEGVLSDDRPPSPPPEKLREAVSAFRSGETRAERELLLRAFAAQSAIEWPELDALLAA